MWTDCDNLFWTGFISGLSLAFCGQLLIKRLYTRYQTPLLNGEEGWTEMDSNSPKSGDSEISI